ncbi:MAG: hypothetical protein JXR49_22465 [Acidobacteria bacterium]|nr:hypothetical protein [Acidobacteriota bacterium]
MDHEKETEEERVKSALEIAMERISGLPELTPEEIAEQKEREYRPVGEALANKYMQEILDENDLLSGFNDHQGVAGTIVRRALVAHLCRSIQLDDFQATVRAMNGLCQLAGDAEGIREKANTAWTRILDDFENRKNKTLQENEASERERLNVLGISGSAVRPNLKDNESLKKKLDELHASFEPGLEGLRAVFLQQLQPE